MDWDFLEHLSRNKRLPDRLGSLLAVLVFLSFLGLVIYKVLE